MERHNHRHKIEQAKQRFDEMLIDEGSAVGK